MISSTERDGGAGVFREVFVRFRPGFAKCAGFCAGALLASSCLAADVGDAAPDFRLPGSDGQHHALTDYRGKFVVVAFFPKAFTGG